MQMARFGAGLTRGAGATAIAAGISEAALQETQLNRQLSESLLNVAGATVLGGALGGAADLLSIPSRVALAKATEFETRIASREGSGKAWIPCSARSKPQPSAARCRAMYRACWLA